jgi:hypothetical protein
MEAKSKKNIKPKAITTEKNTDCYLEVKSDAKQKKEAGMTNQFEQRFEEALQRIQGHTQQRGCKEGR